MEIIDSPWGCTRLKPAPGNYSSVNRHIYIMDGNWQWVVLTHCSSGSSSLRDGWLRGACGAQKGAETQLGAAAGEGVRVVGARVPPNATVQDLDHSHGSPVVGREGAPGPVSGVGPYHLEVALVKQVSGVLCPGTPCHLLTLVHCVCVVGWRVLRFCLEHQLAVQEDMVALEFSGWLGLGGPVICLHHF